MFGIFPETRSKVSEADRERLASTEEGQKLLASCDQWTRDSKKYPMLSLYDGDRAQAIANLLTVDRQEATTIETRYLVEAL